ncbi:chromate transporter [Faecalicoccus pleomorphus]|uniref:chromate transporter n=1 Tax=Faecalicoccus pleomorphus TaxID=1323 RepID=UPI00232D7DC7|nr:chromate transporter [Faecalicoccus pleomorphus]MDB7988655.1 chromate transporter [Faecalicoccus pleomorphus]MDB7992919.1 chromate transporter [Faecalicoccus pleomorphus]
MKKDNILLKIFISTFSLSAFTFGGGYVIVPLMRKKFVEEFHWIEEEEMMDLVAIAQSAPGVIAVNASIIIGYRIKGIIGAIVSVFGTVLPPFLIITIISFCYDWFITVEWIRILLFGMQAGVCAVICDVVCTMAKDIVNQKQMVYVYIMLVAFILNVLFDVHLLIIIVGCGVLGYLIETKFKKGETK